MDYTLEGLFGIRDQVFMISGGTGSIGREISRGLLSLGARLGIMGSSAEKCQRVHGEIAKDFPEESFLMLTADITDETQVNAAVDKLYERFGRIDGLVNCAGINIIQSLNKTSMDDFNKVMGINFTGTVICCKSVGRYMLKAGKGRVVNISSLSSVQGKSYYTAYASSKAAINSFTRALAIEWAKKGINVNAICPGMIVTDINRRQFEENPDSLTRRVASIPRGEPGRLEWLISPIVCLLSPGSAHLTGQAIFVDGGSSAGDTFVLETKRFEND